MSYPWQGTGSGLLQLPIPPKADSFPLKCSLSQNHLDLLQTYEIPIRKNGHAISYSYSSCLEDWTREKRRRECHSSDQELQHRAASSGRPYFTKDTSAAWQNQVLIYINYMLTAQYQGSCWHCFPSKRQKRNSSRKGSAQLVKVHKVFSFQD